MIDTSAEYKAYLRSKVAQTHQLLGTLTIGQTTKTLTNENFLEGSLSITNQLADSNNVCVGAAYIGQLEVTLIVSGIQHYTLKNATLELSMYVGAGDGNDYEYENMPLGFFTIDSASWTNEGIKIVAYDNMSKLDKKFVFPASEIRTKTAYQWYQRVCSECGVSQAIPNPTAFASKFWCGNKSIQLDKNVGDITTWRGIIARLAQCLCACAVVTRDGLLDLVPLNMIDIAGELLWENVSVLDTYNIADYKLKFGGFYYKASASGDDIYYGVNPEGCSFAYAGLAKDITVVDAEITTLINKIYEINTLENLLATSLAEGKITLEQYEIRLADYEAEKQDCNTRIGQLQDEISDLQDKQDDYSSASDPNYQECLDMNFGYNPFMGSLSGWTYTEKWELARQIRTYINYIPFEYTMVGDIGYELGDVLWLDYSEGLRTMVMSYEIDPYCVKVEGLGANGNLQSAKAIEMGKMQGISNQLASVQQQVTECFQSVSDGKDKVAAAISDRGIPTAADASFDVMAENVRAIPSGGGGGTIILYNALADFKHLPKKCNFYQGKMLEYEVPQSDYYVVFPAHSSHETARYDNLNQRQPLIDVCKLIFQELRNLFVNTMGLVRADSNGNHDGWYATGTSTDSYKYAYESFALPSDSQDAPFQYLTIRNAGTSSGNTLIRIGYTASIGQDGNTDILNINGQYQDLVFPSVGHGWQGEYWMDYSINLWVLDNDRVTLWSVIGSLEDAVNVNNVINAFCIVKNIKVEGDDDTHSRAFYNAENGLVTLRDGRTKSVSQHPSMSAYSSSGTALFYPAGLGTFSPDTLRRNGAIDAFHDDDYYFGIDILTANLPSPSGMSGDINKVTVDDIEYIRVCSSMLYKAGGN